MISQDRALQAQNTGLFYRDLLYCGLLYRGLHDHCHANGALGRAGPRRPKREQNLFGGVKRLRVVAGFFVHFPSSESEPRPHLIKEFINLLCRRLISIW